MTTISDDGPTDGYQRGPGRPRKEKRSDPITQTIRVSLKMVEKIEAYQRWQFRKTGEMLPRKYLVENAWDEFVKRKDKEPVNLTLLAGEERLVMQRLLRYLAKTPKTERHRGVIVELLRIADRLVRIAIGFQRMQKTAE